MLVIKLPKSTTDNYVMKPRFTVYHPLHKGYHPTFEVVTFFQDKLPLVITPPKIVVIGSVGNRLL